MSLRSMLWTLEEAPVDDATRLLVLLAIAERSDEHGRGAYPSQAWIAGRARCSTRTVTRHVTALEQDGVIVRGDQQIVAHFRSDRRPVVWDIDMRPRPDKMTGRAESGQTPVVERPDSGGIDGPTRMSDTTSITTYGSETVQEPSLELEVPTVGDPAQDAFELAWKAWPRSEAKQAAIKAWKAALRSSGLTAPDLLSAVKQHTDAYRVNWSPADARQFAPYFASWLNQHRWNDPLPQPRGGAAQPVQRVERAASTIELGRQLEAAQQQGISS